MTQGLLDQIKTRGHWQVTVRPDRFDAERIPYSALEQTIKSASVQIRGWDFPHITGRPEIVRQLDYIEQPTDWQHHREIWRFYQSGLFVAFAGLVRDWRDHSDYWPPDKGWATGKELGMGDTLYCYTEFFLFASRFASQVTGDDAIHVEIELIGLAGRQLVMDDPQRVFLPYSQPAADIPSFPRKWTLSRADLADNHRALALKAVADLFDRFDRPIDLRILEEWQATFSKPA